MSNKKRTAGLAWVMPCGVAMLLAFGLPMSLAADPSLYSGVNAAVCQELVAKAVTFPSFGLMQVLPLTIHYGSHEFQLRDAGLAKIDINNDGMPVNVVHLSNEYCSSGESLAVVDLSRTRVETSALNDLLIDTLTEQQTCGFSVTAFNRAGTTYIDVSDGIGVHVVYLIRNSRADQICRVNTFLPDITQGGMSPPP